MLHTFSIKLKTLSEVHTLSKAPNRGRGGGIFFLVWKRQWEEGDIRILLGWGKFLFEIQITKRNVTVRCFLKRTVTGRCFSKRNVTVRCFSKRIVTASVFFTNCEMQIFGVKIRVDRFGTKLYIKN